MLAEHEVGEQHAERRHQEVIGAGSGGAAHLQQMTIGFSGAAAQDGGGKFAGIALLKPVIVAGPANAAPPAQATLVPADTVRNFLKAHGINAAGESADAKAAVVRVICVRK